MSLYTKTVTLGLVSVLTMGGVQAQNLVANGSFENWTYTSNMTPIPFPMAIAGHVPPWTYSLAGNPVNAQFHRQSAAGLHRDNGIHLTEGGWIQQMIAPPKTHYLVVLFNSGGTRGAIPPRQATIRTSFGTSAPQISTMSTPTLSGPQKYWASTTLAHVFPAGGPAAPLTFSTGDVTGVSLDDVYAIATNYGPGPATLLGAAVGNECNSTNSGGPLGPLTPLMADLRQFSDNRAVTIDCDPKLLSARLFVVGRRVGTGPISFKWSAKVSPVSGIPGKVYQRVHLYNWTKHTWWDFDSVPPKPVGYGVSLLPAAFPATPFLMTPPAVAADFVSPPGTGNLVIARLYWSYAPPVPKPFPGPQPSGPFFRVAVNFASF